MVLNDSWLLRLRATGAGRVCARVLLLLAGSFAANQALAQTYGFFGPPDTHYGRPRMLRTAWRQTEGATQPPDDSPGPFGPQMPRGADDQPFGDFDPLAEPPTGGAPEEETTLPEPTPEAGPAQPAPMVTPRPTEPEEELYEPIESPFESYYEEEAGLPPNACSKEAISQYAGPRDWYADVGFIMYHRTRPDRVNFAYNTAVSNNQLFFIPIFGTEDFDYSFEAGGRATLGRGLWVDSKQRDHSLELTYVGTNAWDILWLIDRGGGTPLTSGFDVNGPLSPFDSADRYRVESTSDFQSFELNYVIRRRLERDRLVYSPNGTWRREAYPGWRPAIAFGARFVSFEDAIDFRSETTTATVTASGQYQTDVTNNMIGLQLGGEAMYQTWKYSFGVRGKAGGLINFSETHTFLEAVSTSTAVNRIDALADTLRNEDLSVAGELDLVMNYRLTERLTFRASWDFIWLGGISLAPEQMTFNRAVPIHLNNSGFVFIQGADVGFELSW